MNPRTSHWLELGIAAASALTLGACLAEIGQEDTSAFAEEDDDDRAGVNHTKIVGGIKLNSAVEGRFNGRVRKYGYLIDAQAGSTLTVKLDRAIAGSDVTCTAQDAQDGICVPPGAKLDTAMYVFGPFPTDGEPDLTGVLNPIAASEDAAAGDDIVDVAAPPIEVQVPASARYLVMFESHVDTGSGEYRLSLGCTGTEFQCQQPSWDRECRQERRYVQGSVLEGVVDTCETIVLESVTVPAGKTLAIKPGVEMQMNYLGTGAFGTVALNALGRLEAIGTEEHPIRFTAHSPQLPADSPNGVVHQPRGWAGLVLGGDVEHQIEHTFIEYANNAITVNSGARALVSDVVLDGIAVQGTMPRAGVTTNQDVQATFTRALVKGYQLGLFFQNSLNLLVEDSVVRNNQTGVWISGATPVTSCPSSAPPAPPPSFVWRDPVIRHSDIYDNTNWGVYVYGSDILVQIEKSNIRNNRQGIGIHGTMLAEGSYIRENNILGNNPIANAPAGSTPYGFQLQSLHRTGVLQVQSNYWMYHSDPELAQMRNLPCNNAGVVSITGFQVDPIADAGPRAEDLCDAVQRETWGAQAH